MLGEAAPIAMLALAVIVHIHSDTLASLMAWRAAAVETVLYGTEAAAAWVYIGATTKSRLLALTAIYGLFESAQRVICRPMHPMDVPLLLPVGMTTCGAAGIDTAELSAMAVCCVVVVWRARSAIRKA